MDETTRSHRTDVHRPAALVTEDYEYLFAIDNQSPWALDLDRDFLRELVSYEPATADRGNSQCHHCGAHVRYAAFLRYLPTGRTIVVGETCLDNRFSIATAEFHRLRKQAELDRAQQRIVKARAAFVEANPDLAWLQDERVPEVVAWNDMVVDIARKFKLYGDLSEPQAAAVRKVYAKSVERESRPKPVDPDPVPAPSGRVVVTGKVLTAQWRETDFGSTLKLLLQVPEAGGAWKLWVTCPSKLAHPEKGDEVTLRATVEPSSDDPAFAFGKRPTLVA